MEVLHQLGDFLDNNKIIEQDPGYWYQGKDPQTGELLQLPRTTLAEAIARGLMQQLASDLIEGKMYGILLVETPKKEQRVLKAFSGLLEGKSQVAGWVPPITGRSEVSLNEVETLALLESLKQELIGLQQLKVREAYEVILQEFKQPLEALSISQTQRKQARDAERQRLLNTLTDQALATALEQLNQMSRQDGLERRRLKEKRDQVLLPLKQLITQADRQITQLKQQRKLLSGQLQSQLYQVYSVTNFQGKSTSLEQLMNEGQLPTGTGECCAPKLLHYAATHHLRPLAMAEFWWGSSTANKKQGQFYGACRERCQPLMGFLLSGLSEIDLSIVYQDQWLVVVNKPAGLLSVPGRYGDRQDSVESRLRLLFPHKITLKAVHRLDQDTSGLLVLAWDEYIYSQLSQQFARGEVEKVYEAILEGLIPTEEGVIELPLWSDPDTRPYQKVDWQYGKPSITRFRLIAEENNYTRIEFTPLTGRTHQLRVHASHSQGLGVPILGDRLYGHQDPTTRLHLHAKKLFFAHPAKLGEYLPLEIKTPF